MLRALFALAAVATVAVGSADGAVPHRTQRFGHSQIVASDGSIVVYGGISYKKGKQADQTDSIRNDVWMFDRSQRQWVELWPDVDGDGVGTPSKRAFHGKLQRDDQHDDGDGGRRTFRAPGKMVDESCGLNDIWDFDVGTRTSSRFLHTKVTAKMPLCAAGSDCHTARHCCCCSCSPCLDLSCIKHVRLSLVKQTRRFVLCRKL